MRPDEPRSRADLIAALDAGHSFQYLCFWGHKQPPTQAVTASCLSQWFPSPFTADGRTFQTAEHYMMWRKATLFGDPAAADRILQAPDPGKAKALGRTVRGFDEAVWTQRRAEVVAQGNVLKFGQHPALRAFLLATAPQVLVEASPVDRIWGIGLSAQDPDATQPHRWRGLNLLGFALMEARAALAA